MKHYALLIAFFYLILNATTAQISSISNIQVGGSVSGGTSFLLGQNNYGGCEMDYKLTEGFAGGVFGHLNWFDKLGLQVEVNFALLGQEWEDTHGNDAVARDLNLGYIQIPILFRYTDIYFSTAAAAPNLYVLVGPQLSFLQAVRQQYYRNGVAESFQDAQVGNPYVSKLPDFTEDDEQYRAFEMAAVLGIGLEFPIARLIHLQGEFRYNIGISDVNQAAWRFPDVRNQYIGSNNHFLAFRFGVAFSLL